MIQKYLIQLGAFFAAILALFAGLKIKEKKDIKKGEENVKTEIIKETLADVKEDRESDNRIDGMDDNELFNELRKRPDE